MPDRNEDLHVADRSVRANDALEQHRALHLGAHRVGGVLRLHFVHQTREDDAVAWAVHPAAGAATTAGAKPGSRAGTDATARSGPRPRARSGTLR
jgi:hypothetical protein